MKKKFKYIIVILVYRNTQDLKECIESINDNITNKRIVVVNSYYDEESKLNCKNIAESLNCDFINVVNKGYSFGNNQGIDFALLNYDFDYIIVSNPDTIVVRFDDSLLNDNFEYDIIAPKITTLTGKRQNPMTVYRHAIIDKSIYIGLKKDLKSLFILGIMCNKILRILNVIKHKILHNKIYTINCAHGSFIIISKKAINILKPIFDEHIFLFAEENVLSIKAKRNGLNICYYDNIHIKHKEDGSMKLSNLSIDKFLAESNIYVYENYLKTKN